MDKEIAKKYGKLAVVSGEDFVSLEREWVPISPALDMITGGIPGGSYVILTGDQKCGKTVSALHIAKNAQKLGRKVFFFNIEGRIKKRDLEGIRGLKLDKEHFEIIRSYRDPDTNESRILLANEFLEIAEYYIHTVPGAVLILDSISMLLTENEQTSDIEQQHRAPGAKLMANFLRRMSNVVPVNDTIVICIQQLISNTSGYGKTKVRSGGRKISYAVDIDLEAKKVVPLTDNNDYQYGQQVTWVTGSTASIAPGQKIDSTIRYGIGIDEVIETIDIGLAMGFLEQGGAWFSMPYMESHIQDNFDIKNYKTQGKPKLYQRLLDNPEELTALQDDIKGLIK